MKNEIKFGNIFLLSRSVETTNLTLKMLTFLVFIINGELNEFIYLILYYFLNASGFVDVAQNF